MRYRVFLLLLFIALFAAKVHSQSQADSDAQAWNARIPAALVGPYIIDIETLAKLDAAGAGTGCKGAGPLNFQCLIFLDDRAHMTSADLARNPFTIPAFDLVRKTVESDLLSIPRHPEFGGDSARRLDLGFLLFPGAKIELVGVVNRMDRQFNQDDVPGHGAPLACGEISAIYRFGYEGDLPTVATGQRHYRSRLPVTMNVVFPAIPWSKKLTCAQVAQRWVDYVEAVQSDAQPDAIRAKAMLLVSSLRPEDIDRIELNMQGSRVPASADNTDFGTLATYIIRVFRWLPGEGGKRWRPSYLTNQIDRARLQGLDGDDNSCAENWGKKISKKDLSAYLLSMNAKGKGPNAIGDVDFGLVNIPLPFLACRAISISPGGGARSGNQPFWHSSDPSQSILDDAEIEDALVRYRKTFGDTLNFVGNAEEFRTRLNESSCSGCHQTRAIAGFHFPGTDRADTASVNAVFLPGSPHFFGDQLRRMKILRAVAKQSLDRRTLAASYASRPQNSFSALKPSAQAGIPREQNMQLVGGWGGACLIAPLKGGVRNWSCAAHLTCAPVFQSANQPQIGMCVNPAGTNELGDAMQFGSVASTRFASDRYSRINPALLPGSPRNTTISTASIRDPAGNSYFAAHQEYYAGKGGIAPEEGESAEDHARRVRDQGTGGFPAGALRLSECRGLESEATCGLLASSGFNDCLDEVGRGKRTPESCFGIYTNYAGVRACDPANPCRDDYICLRPMGYTQKNATGLFEARAARRKAAQEDKNETADNRRKLAINYFGEKMPDDDWLSRNDGQGDRRGVCIPPYFVFQFKADGHQVPAKP